MKTTGALWKAYLASWPESWWYDDSDETFNGEEPTDDEPNDADTVEVTCGVVYPSADHPREEGRDLIRDFNRWKRSLSMLTLVVEIPKDHVAELRLLVAKLKGTVRA